MFNVSSQALGQSSWGPGKKYIFNWGLFDPLGNEKCRPETCRLTVCARSVCRGSGASLGGGLATGQASPAFLHSLGLRPMVIFLSLILECWITSIMNHHAQKNNPCSCSVKPHCIRGCDFSSSPGSVWAEKFSTRTEVLLVKPGIRVTRKIQCLLPERKKTGFGNQGLTELSLWSLRV